ncbi:spore coat protein [Anaerocolumna sedimenticola]|uniref:Spore coat protein n=1 Tax=Anaerocolumna sedimenticola TaxID=2696063 RepID=A0A6P1TNW1_9FIRM|nr:spore coat protein [Anaerocolumna sedimenticola]QHQ61571.1 spore coat protein [Anaerocolumna sedimenticola]
MQQQDLAPNETMQLHEILTLKNLCLTKSITMSPLISDEELKTIIKNDIQKSVQHIKELREYLDESMIASSGNKE